MLLWPTLQLTPVNTLANDKFANGDVTISDDDMYVTELLERYVITLVLPSSRV
jgi:hypothetical protein